MGHHLQLALLVFLLMPTSTFTDVHMGMHCNLHFVAMVVIHVHMCVMRVVVEGGGGGGGGGVGGCACAHVCASGKD